MRQLFLSQYKHRHNPILITYQNNYHKLTFIENDLNHLIKKNRGQLNGIEGFTELVEKYKQNIAEIQSCDFRQRDLDDVLLFRGNINEGNGVWQQNVPVINQLSQQFTSMSHTLSQSLTKTTLHPTLLTLTHFNCLQLRLWQRLFCFICHHYKSSPLHQHLTLITSISQYMKKFEFSFNNKKPAFKFMYPQSYIIDLVDFRELFKSLDTQDDFMRQGDEGQVQRMKLMILQNLIYLIMKATKKADMNIYLVRQYFAKRAKQMIRIADNYKQSDLHSRVLYNIYFIYSYLNYNDGEFYSKIQKNYFEMLRSKFNCDCFGIDELSVDGQGRQVQGTHVLSKEVNKLLSVWKLNQRHNYDIYHQLVRPFLIKLLQNNQQKMYYSNIAINLLTAGINDIEVFNKMILSWETSGLRDDEFMHMLKHYLNVSTSTLSYQTDYHNCHCYQNPKIISYLYQKSHPVYSQCLLPKQQPPFTKSLSKPAKSSQHHRTQRIWSDIVKSIFEPKYEVIENANICNYQIDFLILTDKKIYAIQIQGGHYNKKDFNSQAKKQSHSQQNQKRTTGKREVREIILKAYNIQFVKIHCEEKLPTYIMQSRNIPAGKKYISQKIFNTTNVRVQDI